jgi:hypothetical protein
LRVLSRSRLLLPLVGVLAGLLAPTSARAADDGVYILATEGVSGPAPELVPLGSTMDGLVYRDESTGTIWVKATERWGYPPTIPQQENRLGPNPTVVGGLMSRYDAGAATLRWRTIADPTLHDAVVPPDLTFVSRTSRGYLASRGTGPSTLVSVSLYAGGAQKVIGDVEGLDGLINGDDGALVPEPGAPNRWRYFPYDGSFPAGRVIQAPAGADDCIASPTYLFCWSATELTRLPLNGATGSTVPATVASAVESGIGNFAWTSYDAAADGYEIWIWRLGMGPLPVRHADSSQGFQPRLAPGSGDDVVLAVKPDGTGGTGIYGFPTPQLIVGERPRPAAATSIALGPGRVAWGESAAGIRGRDIALRRDGGLEVGPLATQAQGDGTALGVSGRRIAYADGTGLATTVAGDPAMPAAEVVRSTLSGSRVVWQSRDGDGVLAWQLTDLTGGTTDPLPDALAYDLWGERLVRLDADGSVWLHDLRTGADPLELAPALDGGAASGTVQVAGDAVAWDVTPADAGVADPGVLVRDVASMQPAEPVSALGELHDLSTGYAVGCAAEDAGCAAQAVSLADGTVTPVNAAKPLVVDGNRLGFITTASLPALRLLPAYADAPRLLADPGGPATVDVDEATFAVRVTASQPLTSCALRIRDQDGALLRTVPCAGNQYGVATAEWNGSGATSAHVPDGTYTWEIAAANANGTLVDYDGSAASGTVIVDGPPGAVQFAPARNSYRVPLDTSVAVTFDEPVTDVDAGTFRLLDPDGSAVPGEVTYDEANRRVSLDPTAALEPLTWYTVSLAGITDLRGNPVPEPSSPIAFATGPAANVPHCALTMPTKVVIGAKTTRTNFGVASNCRTNAADHAYWNLLADSGGGWNLRFEADQLQYPSWYLDWSDLVPLGRWTLRPVEAERADDIPLPQNTAVLQVKYASRLAAGVTRTASSLSWSATATQWSGAKHTWVARPKVSVGLFHLAPGSTTWKYVKAATTSSTGRATVTLGSPRSGSYRLTIAETPTVWAAYSTAVRER